MNRIIVFGVGKSELMQCAHYLNKFAYLVYISHAKPYIVINIDPYRIRPRGRRRSIDSLRFLGFRVEAFPIVAALLSVNHSFPLLSIAIRLVPLSLVGGEYSVIPPVCESTFPILWPDSLEQSQGFPSESTIMPIWRRILSRC